MQDIRVLVADDEIPARGELKYELATIASRSSENARTEKKSSTS